MRIRLLLRSAAFKLTLLYAAVFELSVLVLFAVIYVGTAQYMRSELDSEIERELSVLYAEYKARGLEHLRFVIASRVTDPEHRETLYLLQSSTGKPFAGNMGPLRAFSGWADLPHEVLAPAPRRSQGAIIRSKAVQLLGGELLAIGESTSNIDEVHELVIRAFALASIVTLALAIAGGALLSYRFLRRVDAIERRGREIVDGNLSRRLPVSSAGDEFDRLADSFNHMLDRIQSLMDGLRQVTSDIAHDLRTPLARLRARLETTRLRAKTRADYQAAIDETIAETEGMLRTFGALLRIAQIESGSRRAGFTDVDLSALFRSMIEIYGAVAEDRGQTLVGDAAPAVTVRGDRELLMQMLSNLIENALTHSPAGAKVTVKLECINNTPVGLVADSGPGIPAEQRAKVFQRFYRLDASRSTPGSGLGLSLVAAIAGLHGITVELTNNNPGLRVAIRFQGNCD